MHQDELTALFDDQASTYDQKWSGLSSINSALHLMTRAVLADIPSDASILSVGAGTGAEIVYLSEQFPKSRFIVVEPSGKMLERFRVKADELGILSRCNLHHGFLDTLPAMPEFHAATCFLVSQFILDRDLRSGFFREISHRLADGGLIVSSDLAADTDTVAFERLLRVWFALMKGNSLSKEDSDKMRAAYAKDVAILSPKHVEKILSDGGFQQPTLFYQAGLIHAWFARKQ